MRVVRSTSALRLPLTLTAALVAAVAAPAGAQAPARVSYAPAGWDDGAKLREAVDTSHEAMFLTDHAGAFTWVNAAFTRLGLTVFFTGTTAVMETTIFLAVPIRI